MASLHTFIKRQFARWVRKFLATPRPQKRHQNRAALHAEWLEPREVFSTTSAVNPIVAENMLPGTPESVWDVPGAGDASIQGFATDISVNQGQTISFKINDTSLAPYHIDIYRVGYYQGLGAHLVTTIAAAQTLDVVQPSPKFDPTTALVDAGNWSATASWAVPTTATSGVYFARVARNDTGGAFMIMFVVRADSSHSQVLFQTSDATWQAYNTWGGYSLYQATGAQGPGYSGAAYAVSYNRPLIDRGTPGGLGDTNSFFYDEFPMVEWLEQNGYAVSYFTDVDADRNGALILNHQIYMDVGHDEYWSGNQMANITAARDAGVNLAFFSGNEAFWKTYYSASIDGSNTADRTLVCYKETHGEAITDTKNPGIWTGTWMDPTFASATDPHYPQNQLTGTLFTVNRGANDTGTPFTVPYSDSQLRIWRNTSVAHLQAGQTATLGDAELGYEWDEDIANGFRPAGEIDVSSTTQSVTQKFIDYGNTTAPGTATNSMIEYRAKSGALVFSAGMVQFDWGLFGYHDGANGTFGFNSQPVPALQQMMVNLFADMGAQPGTIQSGLVAATASADVTPPKSTITSPSAGTSLPTGVAVTITGTAQDSGGGVVAGVEVSTDGGQTWHPATGTTNWSYTWVPSAPGSVTLLSRATDDSLNTEIPGAGVTVTVTFQATSRTGLVAEYSFNQSSGTTLTDTSGNHNNGTISNGTWVNGLFGDKALSFNGQNTWVTIPNSSSLNPTGALTMEAWVNPASLNGAAAAIAKEMTGGLTYGLYAANDGGSPPQATIDASGTSSQVASSADLPVGTWSHIAATYDGTILKLYVNGNIVSSLGVEGLLSTSSGVLRIGGDSIWGEFFNGLMDDVRIYNRALNQAEIRSDMSTPIGGSVETTAPTAAVTGPASGASVSGVTTLTASASDAVLVTSVQFLLNGRPLGAPLTAAPYTLSWNSLAVPNGTYTLTAVALNGAGLSTTSAPVSITVANAADTVPPTVAVTAPLSGSSASGVTVLSADAADPVGVTGVQFQLNGANIGALLTTSPYRLAYDFSSVANGTYTLTAVATDAAGLSTTSAAVTLTISHAAPTVVSTTITNGATGVSTASNFSVTFSEPIQPASLVATLVSASGSSVPLTVSYDNSSNTATFTHGTIALDPLTTYTVTLSGITDLSGNVIAAPYSWSFTTTSAITGATIFSGTTTPLVTSVNDPSAIEVGLAFESQLTGVVTGVRFYKGALNTGTHIGHLWTATGTLLGTVTFTNETAQGWQQANFATPISIAANTLYVVSYYAPNGEYSADANYFEGGGVTSGPLVAPASNTAGGNGLYRYITGGGFPNTTFSGTNYWVDVVFSSTTVNNTPPAITVESPLPGATGVATNTALAVTFSKSIQASTITFTVKDASGNPVAGSVSYTSGTDTATFTPTTALAASTTYTATVSGATDLSGNVMPAPFSWSFTTTNPSAPPSVVSVTPAAGTGGVAKGTTVTATFSKSIQDTVMSFVVKDAAGNVIAGTVTYDDESNIATFTPSTALSAGTTYTATLSNVLDLSGNAMANPFSWSFTTAFALIGDTIWSPTATPLVADANDSHSVEVGLKFESSVAGLVTGVRFYKGALNTGTHIGHLWTATGTLLGTVTFTGETASGWQQANFSTPISIAANTVYVVSYYAPNGEYSADANYFSAGAAATPLTALANGTAGGNGIYSYVTGGGFPSSTYNATNYWVDVVFSPVTNVPVVNSETPAAGASAVAPTTFSATFNEAVQASTITFTVTDPAGNAVAGTAAYNSNTDTVTFTPTSPLDGLTTYTATVSGATDLSGNAMAGPFSWTFTTAGTTLFGPSATPANTSVSDSSPIELGVRFFSDIGGYITGIRFYKGVGNTGTHVVHLWTASGTLLGTATATNETATGWQQANFATPIDITANTLYVASYYAPVGNYAATGGFFATTGVDNGTIHAPASGANGANGLYTYATGGAFPTNSYNATNYWVDPVFTRTIGDHTAPTVASVAPAVNMTAVPTTAPIAVTFSKDVQAGSISLVVKDPSGNTVAGTLSYNGTTKTATFTPTASLAANVTYTVTVSGVTDLSGNVLAQAYQWSFTTGNTWTQSTAAQFGTGTTNGTQITSSGVSLAPVLVDNFTGTALSTTKWTVSSWTPFGGGTTSTPVSGGVLSVGGAEVLSTTSLAMTPVEGEVSFGATAYQHFGLATDLGDTAGNYWAIFSTGSTTNQLFARVNANGATTDVNLGALPSGFHDYKIVPTATGFQFFIDGALQATIGSSFQTAQALKVVMSDFNATAPLQAESIKFEGYSTTQTGTFTSQVFDAGQSVTWSNMSFTANVPTGTSLSVTVQVGTKQADGTILWQVATVRSDGTLVDANGNPVKGEFLQYSLQLTTTDPTKTPTLESISFTYA
jgi:methionine-rich copper-binding protein CopC